MPELQQQNGKKMEYPFAYGMGETRPEVLMELYVLTENEIVVGVFSSRYLAVRHCELNPFAVDWEQNSDGIVAHDRVCNYRIQRFVLNQVRTDA